MTIDEDSRLLAAARTDASAFGVFFDRQHQPVFKFCVSRVRSVEVAADLTAETFAAALDGLERFDPTLGSARQWLFGIAHHQVHGFWRELRVSSEVRERLTIRILEVDGAALSAFARVEGADSLPVLRAALGRLPMPLRAAVEFRVQDELTYDEIAVKLGCSVGAARVRVHRGLRVLAAELEGFGFDG